MSKKNKKQQSPKQKPERPSERAMRESTEERVSKEDIKIEPNNKEPKDVYSFEITARSAGSAIRNVIPALESIARTLDTETIFGIQAGVFKNFCNKIAKYPEAFVKKAAKQRRIKTATETKEERKTRKAKKLREKIAKFQDELARL